MIYLFFSLAFYYLATICDAIMDTVDFHFTTSIFNKIKSPKWRKWFNESEGWKNKYVDYDGDIAALMVPRRVKWNILGIEINKPVQLTDSWHFFKMLQIAFETVAITILVSLICCFIITPHFHIANFWDYFISLTIGYGVTRNLLFSLFFDHILISK